MSLVIRNNPYISLLSVSVTWDLSGVTPSIILDNLSQGNDLASVSYAFTAQSPTLTFIHEGDINNPDETGVWLTSILADAWPRPFGDIEWGLYNFFVTAKDGDGNIYTAPVQTVNICRPNGNLPTSTNAYGIGEVIVQTKCDQARVYFQDVTNTSYKGVAGQIGSAVLRVNFPMDNTGTVPAPFEINYFSSAMVPITYSGKGYQFLYTSIWNYEFPSDVYVRIKYLKNDTFGVWCGVDLMPLICEIKKLTQSIEDGSCVDAEAANRKLMLINPKFMLVVIGIFQPLTGVDVPELIEEIKAIGDFDCDCCNAATGILPVGSNAFDGYTFTVVPLGGDIDGNFVVNGYNIQLQLSDISYVFKICDESPTQTTAFEVIPSVSGDGFTKTYCLAVDVTQLAEDILTTISTNGALVNLFNSIVTSSSGNFNLIVDGACIFNTSNVCDYTFRFYDIPFNTTFSILESIAVAAAEISINYSFNLTNLAGLQSYLNSLGYGTFVVSNPSGQTVLITSDNNTHALSYFGYYLPSNPNLKISENTQNCTGYLPLTANQVVQEIINYICALDDSQVKTSDAYEICYVDAGGTKQTEIIAAGESLATFIAALVARGCTTIDYIISQGSVNCVSLKAQFPPSTNVMQPNDYFMGTKQNACAPILPTEAFLMMLTYGQYDATVIEAFCKMVELCGGGNICAPYNVFYATINASSPTDGYADLTITFEHPDAVSHIISYARIDNTVSPVYTTISGILPGQSPYTIDGSPSGAIENGQYRVTIIPVYADGRSCKESVYVTDACLAITSLSAAYDGTNINVEYTASSNVPAVKLNISYPNGGSFSQIYANGATIVVTPPTEVYGVFFATMQPVCDEDSGWFGDPTAQVSFEIPIPYTVIVQVGDPAGGSQNRITNVTDLTGFTLPGTVTEGNYRGGYHAEFTGAIIVTVIQPISVSNNIHLIVNDVEIDCVAANVASAFSHNYSFGSHTFAADDVIKILYDGNPCDVSP